MIVILNMWTMHGGVVHCAVEQTLAQNYSGGFRGKLGRGSFSALCGCLHPQSIEAPECSRHALPRTLATRALGPPHNRIPPKILLSCAELRAASRIRCEGVAGPNDSTPPIPESQWFRGNYVSCAWVCPEP